MSEAMEHAHETIHQHASHTDSWARRVAVLISVLAAVLALTEIGGKTTQNEYLAHHITLSNDWAFYQAKNLRAAVRNSEADLLASLPNATEPAVQTRIKEAHEYADRMHDDPQSGEGMKQLAEKAQTQEVERDSAEERYHGYEYAVGALELAIVLASVSVVIRIHSMAIVAAIIGITATIASIGVTLHLF